MSINHQPEPMLEMYLYESGHLLEQLEQTVLECEKSAQFSEESIQVIFRSMHTIKGSSSMMLFNHIAALCHSLEDLFYLIREEKLQLTDWGELPDLLLNGIDFIKLELSKIRNGDAADGEPESLILGIESYLEQMKRLFPPAEPAAIQRKPEPEQKFYILPDKNRCPERVVQVYLTFDEGCEMENVRAFSVIHYLKDSCRIIRYEPEDILENDQSAQTIRENGFRVWLGTDKSFQELRLMFEQTLFLKELDIFEELHDGPDGLGTEKGDAQDFQLPALLEPGFNIPYAIPPEPQGTAEPCGANPASSTPSLISVSVDKLDRLLDLVGEMVIAEAMVVENPDLNGLNLPNFLKASRQLRKISGELQDTVMSIRMVPLTTTFHKMNRIVRDMCKKLGKEVRLELIGEQTEVDKNIIEHLSDPLMHLIRNAIDHGIETPAERRAKGKSPEGILTLEAINAGSDVHVLIRDDGRGLDKQKIIDRAKQNGLLVRPEQEMTDRDIYGLIFLPGFSTKESVTEYSGRGVGMDVVAKNIEAVGGSISVESAEGEGSCITLKIPLTLAIIEGMNIGVGRSRYTIPTISIRESFRPDASEVFRDPDGNEMIMVRGECYPILRLHELYKVQTDVTAVNKGILVMIEHDGETICLFADELLGQQQVIVKALPNYIRSKCKIGGLAGCTLLGDGSINLILDVPGLIQVWKSAGTLKPIT